MPIERGRLTVRSGGDRRFQRAFRLHVRCGASDSRTSHLEDETPRNARSRKAIRFLEGVLNRTLSGPRGERVGVHA